MTTEVKENTIPRTILEQMGGYKFIAMTGTHNLIEDNKSLSMHLKGHGANLLTITLNEYDTYDMHFRKLNTRTCKVVDIHKISGVYADQLQTIFTEVTGLETKL